MIFCDGLLVGTKGLEDDKRVGVEYGDRAIDNGGGGDEIVWEGELGRGEEGEGGDGRGVVIEGCTF